MYECYLKSVPIHKVIHKVRTKSYTQGKYLDRIYVERDI